MGPVRAAVRSRRRGRSCLAVAALLLSLVGSPTSGHAAGRVIGAPGAGAANVFVQSYASPTLWVRTLDPARATDAASSDVLQKIYAGLVKQAYDARTGTFRVVPDLADGLPTVSQDGLVYTFRIRKDARFSDGTPVTARDVVYSINRALNPREQSPVAAFYFTDLLGAANVAAGKARTCRGLRVLNAHTVQMTLDKPVAYFLYALTYTTGFVVKRNLPMGARMTTDPALIVGAGPFMLKGGTWQYRRQITLVPNPHFYGARGIKLKELDLVFVGSIEAEFTAYRSGQYPTSELPAAEVARYRGTPEYRETPLLSTTWYGMNQKYPPFHNRHFRRAIAFALNRHALVYGVLHGTVRPLYGWYPRGILGYDGGIKRHVPHYDPAVARKELALTVRELGHLPGNLELVYLAGSRDIARGCAQMQRDLKAIGITMRLRPMPQPPPPRTIPFFVAGWIADYPDPQDFSEFLLGTGSPGNAMHYSNKRVDALFARADVERNVATRARLYRQAQRIMLNEAPVAMAYQGAAHAVVSTAYHGVELNPTWGSLLQPVHNDWANVTVSS